MKNVYTTIYFIINFYRKAFKIEDDYDYHGHCKNKEKIMVKPK